MKHLVFLIIVCLPLISCEYFSLMGEKEWNEKSQQKGNVYACGEVNGICCYWKNDDSPVYLEDAYKANSIYVKGNDIYVAGQDSARKPCYWKNSVKIPLNSYDIGESIAISVNGGSVINAGFIGTHASFWINEINFGVNTVGASESKITSMFVGDASGGKYNIILGGYFIDNEITPGPNTHPCYWTEEGGEITDLGQGSSGDVINSVFLYEGKVYSAGLFEAVGSFWINNNQIFLDGGADQSNSIYVSNYDIYVVGSITGNFCYWKNNKNPIFLQSGTNARSLKLFKDDIYISGQSGNNACYWKNGEGPVFFNDEGTGYSLIGKGSSIFITWDNQ